MDNEACGRIAYEKSGKENKRKTVRMERFACGVSTGVLSHAPFLFYIGVWSDCSRTGDEGHFVYAPTSGVFAVYDILWRSVYRTPVFGGFGQ